MADPIQPDFVLNNAQETLPPALVIQQQRMADAAHKVAWTSGLSALAGAAIPMAFPERIAKSVPLRLLFSTASAVGAGLMGAVTSGYIVMRRLDRQNKEAAMALSGDSGGSKTLEPEIAVAAPTAPARQFTAEVAQPNSRDGAAMPPTSSFAGGIAARDASFATQAAKEATVAAVAGAGIQSMSS